MKTTLGIFVLFQFVKGDICKAPVCYRGGQVSSATYCDRTKGNCPVCLVGTAKQAGCVYPTNGWCSVGIDCSGSIPVNAIARDEKKASQGLSTAAMVGIIVGCLAMVTVITLVIVHHKRRKARENDASNESLAPARSPLNHHEYHPPQPVQQFKPNAPPLPIAQAVPVVSGAQGEVVWGGAKTVWYSDV